MPDDEEIMLVVSDPNYIRIIPKVGGVHRIAIMLNQRKEDFVAHTLDGTNLNLVEFAEAQNTSFSTENFPLNLYAKDEDKYYSSAFLLLEDYNHNFYSNMIIFEISKNDLSDIEEYVYDEVDLLYAYNKKDDYLDWFTNEQMKRYLKLKNRLDEIL